MKGLRTNQLKKIMIKIIIKKHNSHNGEEEIVCLPYKG